MLRVTRLSVNFLNCVEKGFSCGRRCGRQLNKYYQRIEAMSRLAIVLTA